MRIHSFYQMQGLNLKPTEECLSFGLFIQQKGQNYCQVFQEANRPLFSKVVEEIQDLERKGHTFLVKENAWLQYLNFSKDNSNNHQVKSLPLFHKSFPSLLKTQSQEDQSLELIQLISKSLKEKTWEKSYSYCFQRFQSPHFSHIDQNLIGRVLFSPELSASLIHKVSTSFFFYFSYRKNIIQKLSDSHFLFLFLSSFITPYFFEDQLKEKQVPILSQLLHIMTKISTPLQQHQIIQLEQVYDLLISMKESRSITSPSNDPLHMIALSFYLALNLQREHSFLQKNGPMNHHYQVLDSFFHQEKIKKSA